MRVLTVMCLILALAAAGCLDSSAGQTARQHQKQQGGQKGGGSQTGPTSTPAASTNSKAKHWHLIIVLRRRIAAARYAALQGGYLGGSHRDRYPELQMKSTGRLHRMLGRWQGRLSDPST